MATRRVVFGRSMPDSPESRCRTALSRPRRIRFHSARLGQIHPGTPDEAAIGGLQQECAAYGRVQAQRPETRFPEIPEIVESAVRLLADVQSREPEVVRRIFVSPQFGLWVAGALVSLRSGRSPDSAQAATPLELGQIASFAAAAGILASQPFRLRVPVHDGAIVIPLIARAVVTSAAGWAEISLDERGLDVVPGDFRPPAPAGSHKLLGPGRRENIDWIEPSRLTCNSGGLPFDLALEDSDPTLTRLSPMCAPVPEAERDEWQSRVSSAWNILVHRHGGPQARSRTVCQRSSRCARRRTATSFRRPPGGLGERSLSACRQMRCH